MPGEPNGPSARRREEIDMPGPVATTTRPAQAPAETAWWAMDPEQVATRLGTDLQQGLSSEEAARRLAATGPNTLAGQPPAATPGPLWGLLLRFTNTLIVLLLIVALATAMVGDRTTTLAILAAALLNIIVSLTLRTRT
jgi:Ca2+-transporting ATPase